MAAAKAVVASGVKALWVVVAFHGRTVNALIPREVLEERWDVGPEQDDLLRAYAAHAQEIEAEVRRQAKDVEGEVFLVKALTPAVHA